MTAYRQQALACASALSRGPRRVRDLRPEIPDAAKILLRNVMAGSIGPSAALCPDRCRTRRAETLAAAAVDFAVAGDSIP